MDELEKLLKELGAAGQIFTKSGRLRPNVAKMILDARRGELAAAARSLCSLKAAFAHLQSKGRIPPFVHYPAFYSYFQRYGLESRPGIDAPAKPSISEEEMRRMLGAFERKSTIKSRNGRIRPGILGFVLEFFRQEIHAKVACLGNFRAAFEAMEGRLPGFISYSSFRNYFRRFPSGPSRLRLRKLYEPDDRSGPAAEPCAVPAPDAREAPQQPSAPAAAPPSRPRSQPRAAAENGGAPRPRFVPRGGQVIPPEGRAPDTLVKLRDGRLVKAGAPGAPVRDMDETRDGIPKYRLPAEAEEKWEQENDGKEVPVVWEERDYPYAARPRKLWLITKYNPAYPKTYPFKGTDMSMLSDYGRHPELRYMQPMLISDEGRLYDLFYQLPLLGNVEIKRDGTYIFFGYPGKFFHNADSYRQMLEARYGGNRDINPNPSKIAGRKA